MIDTANDRAGFSKEDYLAHTRDGVRLMLDAGRQGLAAKVPSCPGWAVSDVVVHCGGLLRWMGETVRSRAHKPVRPEPARFGMGQDGSDCLRWLEMGLSEYEETMHAADPEERVWTWWPAEQRVRFWLRRAAQEIAVHRWDAQGAHGPAEAIPTALAQDGIDEMVDIMLHVLRARSSLAAQGETYYFRQTDGDGEWLVRLEDRTVTVTREYAPANVAVRGTASDLLLFLWNRVSPQALEVDGDASLLTKYFESTTPAFSPK